MKESCKNEPLAQSGPFQIQHCADCGSFAVHLGPLTFRLDHDALRALGRVVNLSLQRLEESVSAPSTPSLHLVPSTSDQLN